MNMQPYRWDSLKPPAAALLSYLILTLSESRLLPPAPAVWTVIRGGALFAASYAALLLVMGIGAEDRLVLSTLKNKFRGLQG